MQEKIYPTPCGGIHYWVSQEHGPDGVTLVFLPGLTADHRLFDKQVAFLRGNTTCWSGTPPAMALPGRSGWNFP